MIKNYITTALRSFRKHKGFTFINITGLAIGLACCILILLYVQDELSYDKYHDKAEQIYRAGINGKMGNREFMTYTSTPPLARTMIDEFPEVINATRFYEKGNTMVTYGDKKFIENKIFYADSTVFDIFSWQLIRGNPKTALADPFTIVFTESMAKKYFGDEDPINKSVTFDNDTELKITGIMEDVPHNSHFHFDCLVSMNTTGWSERPIWLSDMFATYFLIEEGKTDKDVEAKLPELIRTHVGPQIQENLGVSMEEWLSSGNRYGYFLEPLTGIYLDSEANMQLEPVGDKRYVILFSIVALFILIIACVNFMNLTTAKASNRAKEVGVRKVAGARRNQLITQFLAESVIISLFAMVVAIVLVYLLLPYFNQITQKELTLEYFSNIWYVPGLFLMAIFTGILAGSYSSFSLSSFGIITVLKGKIQ